MIATGWIVCNVCQAPAPDARTVQLAHGLRRLGWHCDGGTHICPPCKEKQHDR